MHVKKNNAVMEKTALIAEDIGLSLIHKFDSESNRWIVAKYGDSIIEKFAKWLKISSNNVIFYNLKDNKISILLEDQKIMSDIKDLSARLNAEGYNVKIRIDYIK